VIKLQRQLSVYEILNSGSWVNKRITQCSIIAGTNSFHWYNLVDMLFMWAKISTPEPDVKCYIRISWLYSVMSASMWHQNIVRVTVSWWVIITEPLHYCHPTTAE